MRAAERTAEAIPEPEIIRLAQQGDPEAFEILYRKHSRRVYALCLRMVGNVAEAEDLTQEAFLLIFRKIQGFRGESAFSTWLHRVTVNLVLMRFRKRKLVEDSRSTKRSRLTKTAPFRHRNSAPGTCESAARSTA